MLEIPLRRGKREGLGELLYKNGRAVCRWLEASVLTFLSRPLFV